MTPLSALSTILCVMSLAFAAPARAQTPHTGHPQAPPAKPQDTSAQQPAEHEHAPDAKQPRDVPSEPIPPITDADRAAAFPSDLGGHTVHDDAIHYFVLFDRLEWRGDGDRGINLENTSWIGGDIDRVWLRAEAESDQGRLENAFAHVLWGRSFSRWWDFVAGLRQDFRPGDPQTWAAVGVQGLAPYWFEIEATGYVGGGGRTHARLEAEYELLLTNRMILQPLIEMEIHGKSDPARGIGAGLSAIETGLRLRYEFRRELAPYLGVTWDRLLFGTADRARAAGEDAGRVRVAVGLRAWF